MPTDVYRMILRGTAALSLRLRRATLFATLVPLFAACGQSSQVDARIDLALAELERGEIPSAMLELTNLVHADPDHAVARLILGQVALAAGRAKQAETQLRRARSLGIPDSQVLLPLGKAILAGGDPARLLENLPEGIPDGEIAFAVAQLRGRAALASGETEAAERYFKTARGIEPDSVAPFVGLIESALARGDWNAADELSIVTTTQHPANIGAQRIRGVVLFSADRFAAAEQSFLKATSIVATPEQADQLLLAHVGLIESQWRLGKRSQALDRSNDLQARYPWHPLPMFSRALLAWESGEHELGTRLLIGVLRLVPGHQPSRQLLAAISLRTGRLGAAESELESLRLEDPTNTVTRQLLGETYLRMGNGAQASRVLQRLHVEQPDDIEVRRLLGIARLRSGQAAAGAHHLRAVGEVFPDDLGLQLRLVATLVNTGAIDEADAWLTQWPNDIRIERARVLLRLLRYLRSGRLERAENYAKKIRRDEPENLIAMLVLAELAEAAGHRPQAMDWLQLARERNPGATEPRLLLARYLLQEGQADAAAEVTSEAASENPYNAEILVLLGEARMAQGDQVAALSAFREAERLAPEFAQARLSKTLGTLAAADFDTSRQAIVSLLEAQPNWFVTLAPRVIAAHQQGHAAGTHGLLTTLKAHFANRPEPYLLEGDLLMLEERYADAHAAYRMASNRVVNDDPRPAFRAAIAGQYAGLAGAGTPLREWLRNHADQPQMRRVLAALDNDSR